MTAAAHRDGWRAVLIGVSRYADAEFTDIPAATTNISDLAELLTAPTGGGLAAEHCTVLADPVDATEVGRAIATAADGADDVLLVYYTGHGVVDRRGGQLYLTLPNTDHHHPEWGSVPFATLRDELLECRARTRILILDCCFSGRAFEAMAPAAAAVDGQIDVQGTYTIASSGRDVLSIAPAGHRHTAFTGALLHAAAETGLTLDQLYRRVEQILHRDGHPRPQRRSVAGAGDLRLFTAPDDDAAPATTETDSETLFISGGHCADRNDFVQAEALWLRAATQGHTGAMNNLANSLLARKKAGEAFDWYTKAAELGNTDAMTNLAQLLFTLKHVDDAERWCRPAASTGYTGAMFTLAVMLDKTHRFDEAITWYRQAADAGHTDAMHNLAIRLRHRGQLSEAAAWWRNAGHAHPQRTSDKPCGFAAPARSR
ncbi:tetratricopeptide repeat protein [Nocardia sp. NPDC059177]|uniref:caspase, EACC1-associated type n=1 Tax=Nocardia sp. NPDC059177 TaxID=3346759 RepID=UPI00368FEC54